MTKATKRKYYNIDISFCFRPRLVKIFQIICEREFYLHCIINFTVTTKIKRVVLFSCEYRCT